MFEVKYNPNAGEANILEIHNDVFKNELTISSVHVWDSTASYTDLRSINHGGIPIDIQYKSNSSGEKLYLAFSDEDDKASTEMIWNVNGLKNIKLTRTERKENDLYEITKEQLFELCMATTLKVQVSGKKGPLWEGEATNIIIILQTVYNEAIDNTMFVDAKSKALDNLNKLKKIHVKKEEDEQRKEKKERNSNIIWIIITAAVVIAFFVWMISML